MMCSKKQINKKNLKLQIFSHIYKYNPERGVRWLQFSQVSPSLLIFNEFSKYLLRYDLKNAWMLLPLQYPNSKGCLFA